MHNIGLKKAFSLLSSDHITIFSHYLADVDAVCSSFLLHSLFPNSEVVFFDKPTHSARNIIKKYGFDYRIEKTSVFHGNAVLVDASDAGLVPSKPAKYLMCIDHHSASPIVQCDYLLADASSPSTTYILYSMMKENSITPDSRQAELILLGILSDTYVFSSVQNIAVFKDVYDLLSVHGVDDYESLLRIVKTTLTDSEKVVFARSFNNYSMYKEKKHSRIFILTDCQSFQSLVATKLVECIGADFGLAYSLYPKEGEVRVSLRSSPRINIHLGKFASKIALELGGSGGGHEHAAGMNLPIRCEAELEEYIISALRGEFSLEQINI